LAERLPASAARAHQAEAAGSRLPPLLVAASHVAATVAQGVHGRRRIGPGDSFWQFRPYVSGDPINRIDWRQSARSGREAPQGWLVRQTEWDAAQTVHLWRDRSESMAWRSPGVAVDKRERADLLLLALASLLLRGGERVAIMRAGARPVSGRHGLERVLADLDQTRDAGDLPPALPLPRHGVVVLIGDFLTPLEEIQAAVATLAALPVTGHLLQVLDPAEVTLPFQGRVRFTSPQQEPDELVPRVESVRDAYRAALKAHQDGMAAICAAAGFGFSVHRTDHPPETALLALYEALAAR
jgi:uncharacterized protein (DUF58 family)